jgi:alkanesulfonate monooxygenase SsuD/methylene tetrahydromethanopterin reductase-like flavin-dependent oxidoreductase (luciferase family)
LVIDSRRAPARRRLDQRPQDLERVTDGDRDEDAIGIAPEQPDVQNGVRMPLIGSPSDITDNMEEWFRGYGVDGFLFHPSQLPGGLDDFVALVIPELQSRGLFRAEYEDPTLRENMGLERPKSGYLPYRREGRN